MRQKPFTLKDLTLLSSFLNQLVFRLLWEVPSVTGELLVLCNEVYFGCFSFLWCYILDVWFSCIIVCRLLDVVWVTMRSVGYEFTVTVLTLFAHTFIVIVLDDTGYVSYTRCSVFGQSGDSPYENCPYSTYGTV